MSGFPLSTPLVVTVILHFNRIEDTLECLESLQATTYPNHQILVLEVASSSFPYDTISGRFPNVKIIRLVDNRGFAGNNNTGIQAALEMNPDWIYLLNNDTVEAPDNLARLVEAGENDPRIGMVGPMIYHYNEPEVIQSAGGILTRRFEALHRGQNEEDHSQFIEVQDVDWLTGCALLVRRETIHQIGGLDERFFLYWEETDWCLRAREAGWRIIQVPQAKIWHKGVQRNYQPRPAVTYYSTRNRFLLMSAHQAPAAAWVFALYSTLRTLASWTLRPKWRSRREHRNAMWRGLIDGLRRRWGPWKT